jgi:hypothetical protein
MTTNRDEGALLWFDDDIKRPLQQKILDGVERYRERLGYEPTEVHLNPAQAKALEEAMQAPNKRRSKSSVPPLPELRLRLLPTESMRPHHFLIGIGPDDTHRKARRPSAQRPEPALATRGRPRRRSDSARLAS